MKTIFLISSGFFLGLGISNVIQNNTLKSIKNNENKDLDSIVKENKQMAIYSLVGSTLIGVIAIYGFKK